MAEQLSFDLPVRSALGRTDFFVSDANALAVSQLDSWVHWPDNRLIVTGAAGSGKTHLSHVWAEQTGAAIVQASEIRDAPETTDALVVEDLHDLSAPSAEEALFHLMNAMVRARQPLLLTSRNPSRALPIALNDLRSRLDATQSARLEAPDDNLLSAVLIKHFTDRQLNPTPDLVAYLLAHMERSMQTAQMVVAELDRAQLSTGRKLARPLATEVLDKLTVQGR